MRYRFLILIALMLMSLISLAQTPDSGNLVTIHQVSGANLGSISSPQIGMLVYNTTDFKLYIYDGSSWVRTDKPVFFDGYDNLGEQVLNQNTYSTVTINTARVEQGGFTINGANEIVIPEEGFYEIVFSVSIRNIANSRSSAETRLKLNDSPVAASEIYTYHRILNTNSVQNQVSYTSSSRTVILNLSAGNRIAIESRKFEGTNASNLRTVQNGSSITIKKL